MPRPLLLPLLRLALLLALGTAVFAAPAPAAVACVPDTTLAVGIGPYDLKVADLNQDERPDLVVALLYVNAFVVVLNDGTGRFQVSGSYPVSSNVAVDVGDFDGDGLPDIAAADLDDGRVFLYRNQGGGVFGSPTDYAMGGFVYDVLGADLDGDGNRDLASVRTDGEVWLRRGLGGGVFGGEQKIDFGPTYQFYRMDAADYDHDGRIDLVLVDHGSGRVVVLRNGGGMSFSVAATLFVNPGASDIVARDLDLDGWVDLAVAQENGHFPVMRNDHGTFEAPVFHDVGGTMCQSVEAADFDGDGLPDLLGSNYNQDNVRILFGQGGMAFGFPRTIPCGQHPSCAAPGDFDGDGRIDLVVGNHDGGTLSVFRTVLALPRIAVDTPSLDFGSGQVGAAEVLPATIRNAGQIPLVVTGITLAGAGFTYLGPAAPLTLNPGASALLPVRYARAVLGSAAGTLSVASNDTTQALVEIPLAGTTVDVPSVIASGPLPVTLAVGAQGTAHVRLRNAGPGPLHATIPVFASDLSESCPQDLGPGMLPVLRADASGALWDLQGNGTVATGTSGEYLGGMTLTNFPAQSQATLGLGGREARFGPAPVPAGVVVTRKVYVPADGAFARFIDVAANAGDLPRNYSFDSIDNVGYTSWGVVRTSSGDAAFTTSDGWIVLPVDGAPGRLSVGRVFRGDFAPNFPVLANYNQTALGSYNRVKFDVTVPPHQRVSLIQYAIQGADANDTQAKATALAALPALEHADAIDRSTSWNFMPGPAVFRTTAGEVEVASGDSLDVEIVFDAASATHAAVIEGTLRIATDDPLHPLLVIPLELSVTGGSVVGIEPAGGAASGLALAGFLPNPVRAGGPARIAYRLASAEPATITLYDVRGRVLAREAIAQPAPGPGSIAFGRRLAAGVVWMRLAQGDRVATKKGIVLP
jgi:hypothetical protein